MVLVVVAVMAIAGYAAAQSISTSKHNLGSTGPGPVNSSNSTEICVFCHTPHQSGVTDDPLWNHNYNIAQTYGVYSSATFNTAGYASDIADIGPFVAGSASVSNLCMSCHDGTIGVNQLYNPPNAIGNVNPTMNASANIDGSNRLISFANLGTNLANDHPVNMTYDNVTYPTLRAITGGGVTYLGNTVPLYANKVQCASCHNPHDNTNGAFLRVAISNSTQVGS